MGFCIVPKPADSIAKLAGSWLHGRYAYKGRKNTAQAALGRAAWRIWKPIRNGLGGEFPSKGRLGKIQINGAQIADSANGMGRLCVLLHAASQRTAIQGDAAQVRLQI